VTRTIPVGGRFSQRQREIYAIVLNAQERAYLTALGAATTWSGDISGLVLRDDAGAMQVTLALQAAP
jgi:hypothetical protein